LIFRHILVVSGDDDFSAAYLKTEIFKQGLAEIKG